MDFLLHVIIVVASSLPNILGFNLLFGRGKIFHFGPLGVSIAAAYGTFLVLMATGSYALGLLTGLVAALGVSLLFSWLSVRLEPDAFGVMSIAAHLGLLTVVLNWQSLTRGALGIPRIPRFPLVAAMQETLGLTFLQAFALLSVVLCIIFAVVLWRVDRGPMGRKLQALAEHPWYGASLGMDRSRVNAIAFTLSAVAAVLTTALFHQYVALLHPSDMGFPAFVFFITVVVAGGPGSVPGTIIACTLLTILREGLRFLPLEPMLAGPLRLMLFGVILFAAVWWRRDTLFPVQRSL